MEHEEEFRLLLGKCLGIAQPPLQVVRIGGPKCLDVYGEYAPYTYANTEQEILDICISGDYKAEWLPWYEKCIAAGRQDDWEDWLEEIRSESV